LMIRVFGKAQSYSPAIKGKRTAKTRFKAGFLFGHLRFYFFATSKYASIKACACGAQSAFP